MDLHCISYKKKFLKTTLSVQFQNLIDNRTKSASPNTHINGTGTSIKRWLFYKPTDTVVSPDEQSYNEERNDFEHYTSYI